MKKPQWLLACATAIIFSACYLLFVNKGKFYRNYTVDFYLILCLLFIVFVAFFLSNYSKNVLLPSAVILCSTLTVFVWIKEYRLLYCVCFLPSSLLFLYFCPSVSKEPDNTIKVVLLIIMDLLALADLVWLTAKLSVIKTGTAIHNNVVSGTFKSLFPLCIFFFFVLYCLVSKQPKKIKAGRTLKKEFTHIFFLCLFFLLNNALFFLLNLQNEQLKNQLPILLNLPFFFALFSLYDNMKSVSGKGRFS